MSIPNPGIQPNYYVLSKRFNTAKMEGLYKIGRYTDGTSPAKIEELCDITGYENNLFSWPIPIYVGL